MQKNYHCFSPVVVWCLYKLMKKKKNWASHKFPFVCIFFILSFLVTPYIYLSLWLTTFIFHICLFSFLYCFTFSFIQQNRSNCCLINWSCIFYAQKHWPIFWWMKNIEALEGCFNHGLCITVWVTYQSLIQRILCLTMLPINYCEEDQWNVYS